MSLIATNIAGDQGLYLPVLLPQARRLKPNRMPPDYTDYYQWEWREVARHAASLHSGWELRGYVTRRESATDRRSRLVALTQDGRAVVERVLRARFHTLEAFADELTPEERDCLYTALLPIVERIASP